MNLLKKYWDLAGLAAIAGAIALWDGGFAALYTVAILMILEVSLSFDNAVVNAKSLGSLTESQQRWFLHWGFIIAVLGMRLLFPILIVSGTAAINPISVLMMTINDPVQYATLLSNTHALVAGFGGAFLMMVGLQFFFDAEKDEHWLGVLEDALTKFGKINFHALIPLAEGLVTVIVLYVIAQYAGMAFFYAGLIGILAFTIVSGIKTVMEGDEDEDSSGGKAVDAVVKGGIATLLFMEVRDASFSFDGVIGAFAISEVLLLIMLGLGVGAYAVRKMTLHLVEAGTLASYKFLEHGAFWAILSLSVLMQLGSFMHISEVITGSIGLVFIAASFVASVIYKKSHPEVEAANEATAA
jgi:hypothetical protein